MNAIRTIPMNDTMHDKFAWHSKLLTNWLRFISLFVVINEITKILSLLPC